MLQKPFNITRKPSNAGLKKNPKGKTQSRDKKGKQPQDYNKVLKIQVECEELHFTADINQLVERYRALPHWWCCLVAEVKMLQRRRWAKNPKSYGGEWDSTSRKSGGEWWQKKKALKELQRQSELPLTFGSKGNPLILKRRMDLQAKQRGRLCLPLSYTFLTICFAAFLYVLPGREIIREITPG